MAQIPETVAKLQPHSRQKPGRTSQHGEANGDLEPVDVRWLLGLHILILLNKTHHDLFAFLTIHLAAFLLPLAPPRPSSLAHSCHLTSVVAVC